MEPGHMASGRMEPGHMEPDHMAQSPEALKTNWHEKQARRLIMAAAPEVCQNGRGKYNPADDEAA